MSGENLSEFMKAFDKGAKLTSFSTPEGQEVNDPTDLFEGLVHIWNESVIMVVHNEHDSLEEPNEVYLEAMVSLNPNQGDGSKALDWLNGLADQFGIKVKLESDVDGMYVKELMSELSIPNSDMTQDELDKFYEGKGYARSENSSTRVRSPQRQNH